MSAGQYPNEFLSIFNSANFNATNGSDTLTQEQADLLYLKYPFGQGSETIPSLIVGDNASVGENLGVGQNIIMSGISGTNYIQFPDLTKQYTASTGGGGIPTIGSNVGNYSFTGAEISAISLVSFQLDAGYYQINYTANLYTPAITSSSPPLPYSWTAQGQFYLSANSGASIPDANKLYFNLPNALFGTALTSYAYSSQATMSCVIHVINNATKVNLNLLIQTADIPNFVYVSLPIITGGVYYTYSYTSL
jgi:hypothetical protein